MLPDLLLSGVRRELEGVPVRDLRTAAAALSAGYRETAPVGRSGRRGPAPTSATAALTPGPGRADLRHLAYLATRMPATYAAVAAVLDELAARAPGFAPRSLLDLGAGPGTATWAACQRFPSIDRITLVEGDGRFAAIAARLLAPLPVTAKVECRALDTGPPAPPADLVVLAYVVGELPPASVGDVVTAAWAAARGALVTIEPGTPAGHTRVLAVRDRLIAAGARIVAPCPHEAPCPLAADDWCHFGVRLARSREHRLVKAAELAWEDEKYTCLAAVRGGGAAAPARVLRRPDLHKGHVRLRVCGTTGIEDLTVRRSDRDAYRMARRIGWGDSWEPSGRD